MKQIGIKYVAERTPPFPDTVAGTSLVWVDAEQVHYVSQAVATKLLQHPDVWAEAGSKEVADSLTDLGISSPPKQAFEREPIPLVPLDTMDRQALIVFAKTQFGQTLHINMNEKNMRAKIQNWMNSPLAGGR